MKLLVGEANDKIETEENLNDNATENSIVQPNCICDIQMKIGLCLNFQRWNLVKKIMDWWVRFIG